MLMKIEAPMKFDPTEISDIIEGNKIATAVDKS